ncbi:MAG: hypothetical protein AAFR38_00415 [Planctomycetota bacterium]
MTPVDESPMKLDIRLEFDAASPSSDPNTGNIWVELNGDGFPERGWADFPIVVLGWWSEALISQRPNQRIQWRFMDGPFELSFEPESHDVYRVRRCGPGEADPGQAMTLEDIRLALIRALEEALQNSWLGEREAAVMRYDLAELRGDAW